MIAMRARSNDSNNDDSLYMMTLCVLYALSVYWCQWHIPIVMMITLQQRSNITILRWWWLRWRTYETLTMTLSHLILAGKRCSQTRLLRWQWLLWRSWHHIDTTSPMQYARHSDFGLVTRAPPVILWHWWHTRACCDGSDFGDTQTQTPGILWRRWLWRHSSDTCQQCCCLSEPPIQQNFLHGIASNKSRHCLIPRAWSENSNCVFGFVWSHLSQFSDREHQTGPTW